MTDALTLWVAEDGRHGVFAPGVLRLLELPSGEPPHTDEELVAMARQAKLLMPVWRGCGDHSADLVGVLLGTNTPFGIQACDTCAIYPGDLDAAFVIAQREGGVVKFYQQNDAISPDPSDAELDQLEVRTFDGSYQTNCVIHGHTDPWVEVCGMPINWYDRFDPPRSP